MYNDLTNSLEEFKPIGDTVGMYVCGPTVYDYAHIGNLRSATSFDVIYRYLKFAGYKVKYVMNITDIDDKMIKKANEEKTTVKVLAERYEKAFIEDMKTVGNLIPDIMPRATEHIQDIINTIQKIIDNGHAYVVNGNVYFDVRSFKDYGKLSKIKLDELESGARVEPDPNKKNPYDFALWKAKKPGEPYWDSPWGPGRPGWHIECSVMSTKYLGQPFDIHGGGKDLIFPHHENEIAQAEAAENKPFVKYWLHNDYVMVNGKKMSKSLGNFIIARDLFKKWHPQIVRYLIVSAHYRTEINVSNDLLEQSRQALNSLRETIDNIDFYMKFVDDGEEKYKDRVEEFMEAFINAMNEDFNAPKAMSVIHDFASFINTHLENKATLKMFREKFTSMLWVFGLLQDYKLPEIPEEIKKLLEEREKYRKNKQWNKADEIREIIRKKGYEIQDTKFGPKCSKPF